MLQALFIVGHELQARASGGRTGSFNGSCGSNGSCEERAARAILRGAGRIVGTEKRFWDRDY